MKHLPLLLLALSLPCQAACPGGWTLMMEVVYDNHPTIEFIPNFRSKASCNAAGVENMKDLEGAVKYICVQQ